MTKVKKRAEKSINYYILALAVDTAPWSQKLRRRQNNLPADSQY
jgi:hypothetical protein